jgi:hypothetical protein
MPASWTRYPTTASIEICPCLISTVRRRSNSKGIEESRRSLSTDLAFKDHVGGDRSAGSLGWVEGGSTGDEGGKDDELHFDYCIWGIVREVEESLF